MLDTIGQIRAVDDLGRIALPVSYRKLLKIHSGDNLNIQPKGDSLVITKFNVFDSTYAKDVCEAIHQSIYYDIAVVDTEKVVACNPDIHLSGRPISEDIYSIEIVTVDGHEKRGKYVGSHVHLNVTYLLEADENEEIHIKEDENSGVKWFPINEVVKVSSEPWVCDRVYTKIIDKMKRDGIVKNN